MRKYVSGSSLLSTVAFLNNMDIAKLIALAIRVQKQPELCNYLSWHMSTGAKG